MNFEECSFGERIIGAVTGFAEKHPVLTGLGIALGSAAVAKVRESISGNGSTESGGSSRSGSNYYPSYDSGDDYSRSTDPEDGYSEPSSGKDYPDERSSPREHDVSGYDRQQNGKTVHVNPYKRGGKNKGDE